MVCCAGRPGVSILAAQITLLTRCRVDDYTRPGALSVDTWARSIHCLVLGQCQEPGQSARLRMLLSWAASSWCKGQQIRPTVTRLISKLD
jgi:hypothetical protein